MEREKGDLLGWNGITGDGGLRFVEMTGCPFASFHAAYSWNVFVYSETTTSPVTLKSETFFAVIIAVIQAFACIVLRLDRLW